MYLINANTYKLEYFVGYEIPKYIILSHCWGKDEVLFQGMKDLDIARKKEGFTKIQFTCHQALEDGLEYAWVDTCCINKESSAELSEAINSMFNWYKGAEHCYAYLSDLEVVEIEGVIPATNPPFPESRWFTRGWTLQELIAPLEVTFMDRNWTVIGTKRGNLLETIVDRTGVDEEVLDLHRHMHKLTVAKRMSWAARRRTTRIEDEAYCLLGIFDINMPMLYGEGKRAFTRLQEELLLKTTDQSLLAHSGYDLLAHSPHQFSRCAAVEACDDWLGVQSCEMTNVGLRIKLPVVPVSSDAHNPRLYAILNCQRNNHRLVLSLYRRLDQPNTGVVFRSSIPVEIKLHELLSFRIEEMIIARHHTYRPSYDDRDNRLWLFTSKQSKTPCVITVKALEPKSNWGLALPSSRLDKYRTADGSMMTMFSIKDGCKADIVDGTVHFELNLSDEACIPIMLGFKLSSKHSPELPYTHEQQPILELCQLYGNDHIGFIPMSYVHAGSTELDPGQHVKLSLVLKKWVLKAKLEFLPFYALSESIEHKYALHICLEELSEQEK